MAKLLDEFGFEYPIPNKENLTFGRSRACDIIIPPLPASRGHRNSIFLERYLSVSRAHGILEQRNFQFFISDANSKFGTYVNCIKVNSIPKELKIGDVVRLGNIKLTFLDDSLCN